MKSYIRPAIIVITVLMLIFLVSGCMSDDDPRRDENYVEATGVRVPTSVVYLSSHGTTSSYQLEPTLVPANATNKKLVYYVSPDALDYFTVDQDGLIVAKKIMEDIDSVPLRIYSSTNPDAYTIVAVVIENIEVEEIFFSQPEMKVNFPSDTIQLDLRYEPYHAQDGRDVTYTSQNEEILTVDSTGLMTIKKPGIVSIVATSSTLSGKTLGGTIQITVSYAPGNFRLDVTEATPKFDQVIGNPEKITFSILGLDALSDPNPDIKWLVAGKRILSQNGEREYEYLPETDSTRASFYITVLITPKNEDTITLTSPLISLYMPFTGFALNKNEPSGSVYRFGEPLTFEPLMQNTDTYDWYLSKQGESGVGKHVGSTRLSEQNGKLIFTPDDYGAFVLTARGKSGDTVISTKTYEFTIIKYVVGDRVQISPQIGIEEKVPDSFDWYLHRYDPEVQSENIVDCLINKQGDYVFTTNRNAVFNYEATEAGWYVLSSTATFGGLPVYENIGGVDQQMVRYSTPFRIWQKQGESNIEYLVVDGAKAGTEYRPVIKWNQLGGVNSFVVEVVTGGGIYIIDTGDRENDTRGIVFSDYSIILPLSMATLEQTFSVRVKQKGGVYCEKVTYTAKAISQNQYYFLPYLNFSINRYIRDMYEMGELLNYITTYKPTELLQQRSDGEATFKINIYTKLVYRNINKDSFPVVGQNPYQNEYLSNIYNIVTAAINAYALTDITAMDFEYSDIDGSFNIILTVDEKSYISQPSPQKSPYQFEQNYETEARQVAYDEFAINAKETINATTSDQLYYAVSIGKRPLPTKGSAAEAIFNEAKVILRDIISDDMTDFRKVLAINDYLASHINSNKALIQYAKMTPKPADLYLFEGYHLEGAILGKNAVSQGVSKAFSLLCWMEGIATNTVLGTKSGVAHSWNKVLIGESWYNVDSYLARVEREDGVALNHAYFLRSDEYMSLGGYNAYGSYPIALDNCDISQVEGTVTVFTEEQTETAVRSHTYNIDSAVYSFGLEFGADFETQKEFRDIALEQIQEALNGTGIILKELLQVADRYFVVILASPF
ncbi:MAG: Ig-like domain-containing protein [Clostridia bacterium]|nr:Ig-like domain-containing protein [Clostridia bacterium]